MTVHTLGFFFGGWVVDRVRMIIADRGLVYWLLLLHQRRMYKNVGPCARMYNSDRYYDHVSI